MCYGKPDHIETGGAGLGITPNEEIMTKIERFERAAQNVLTIVCGAILSPKRWPKIVRRIYLIGSPIFVPLHLLAIGMMAALFVVGLASTTLVVTAVEFWRNDGKEGWR
jgi:hypothetical protein